MTPALTDPLQPILEDIRVLLDDRVNFPLAPGDSRRARSVIPVGIETVIDNCCPNGMSWVRVSRVYPTTNFPTQAITTVDCPGTLFAAELELGITRCAEVTQSRDGRISVERLDAEAVRIGIDRSALIQTVICDLPQILECKNIIAGMVRPLDVIGGCTGSIMDVTIAVNWCCDPLITE